MVDADFDEENIILENVDELTHDKSIQSEEKNNVDKENEEVFEGRN